MPPLVDAYASQTQYIDHLLPIWHALAPDERGRFFTTNRTDAYLRAHGVEPTHGRPSRRLVRPCIVASAGDLANVGARPVILVEHGAGQAYDGKPHPSYSGGPRRDAAVLFLCPNEIVAGRNRATYPDTPSVVVSSPRVEALRAAAPSWTRLHDPTVALSWHWDCRLDPCARWAFPHYEAVLPEIVRCFDVIGHGHPRYGHFFRQLWRRLGVEYVERFDDVAARAACFVADNTSALFEFAALDRPVVVLNAPWYRRDADLWPRFWHHADVGLNVDEPHELASTIQRALCDPPEARAGRQRAVRAIWGEVEGGTQRAADTIRSTVAALP